MRIYATGTTARSSGKGFPADLLKLKEVKKDGVSSFELGNGTVLKSGEYACMEAKVRGPGDAADTEEGTETLFAYTWFDSGLCKTHFDGLTTKMAALLQILEEGELVLGQIIEPSGGLGTTIIFTSDIKRLQMTQNSFNAQRTLNTAT